MRFAFRSSELEELYHTGAHPGYHPNLIRAFVRVLTRIAAALDERDLRACGALHMEKLRGNRQGQYSLRLNDQWRLIIIPERDHDGNYILIIEIADYH
ncbi:MAG: type II toxin-antitoxin system RelE/ParE family toxin [Armatimonadota bacterium]